MTALRKLYKTVFLILILVSPCTGIFALGPWLRLPVLVSLTLLLLTPLFIKSDLKKSHLHIDKQFWIVVLFLVLSSISLFINFQSKKNFTNWLPYLWLFLFNYLFIRYAIRNNICDITIPSILSIIKKTYFLIGGFIIIDFLLVNLFGVQIRTALVNLENGTANMEYYVRSNFLNTGGVAEEPGIMALMMNIFFCLTLYTERSKKRLYQVYLYIFHLVILVSLGSTMGIFSFIVSQVFINWNWRFNVFFIGFLLIAYVFLQSLVLNNPFIQEISNKLVMSEDVESSVVRATLWASAYETFLNHPWLGAGPGYGKLLFDEGFMSLVLVLLSEVGIICFLLFAWFIWETYKKANKISVVQNTNTLKMGIICSTMHIGILSEYYHLPYWLLLAMVYCINVSLNKPSEVEERNAKTTETTVGQLLG
ncbi:MAG TPA: O-antigen ligase family protein [Segetibacter sp.]